MQLKLNMQSISTNQYKSIIDQLNSSLKGINPEV